MPTFIQDLLSLPGDGVHITTSFDGHPNENKGISWQGWPLNGKPLDPKLNQYLTVSRFKGDKRRKSTFICMPIVMIDDVGTKIDFDAIALDPTWRIETSAGNFQYVYFLDEPITSGAYAAGVLDGLSRKLSKDGRDPGMKGVTRYFRPGLGVNGKTGFDVKAEPGKGGCKRYSVGEILNAFEIDYVKEDSTFCFDTKEFTRETVEWIASLDPLAKFLQPRWLGLRSTGWIDILCPWHEEHTGGDTTGTSYLPRAMSGTTFGGFKCHHGHCEHKNLDDLRNWALDNGYQPDAGDWKTRYRYIRSQDRFYDLVGKNYLTTNAINTAYPKVDISEEHEDKPRYQSPAKFIAQKPSAYDICLYLPGEPATVEHKVLNPRTGQLTFKPGYRILNTHRPWRTYPPANPEIWLDLLQYQFPDSWERIADFLAFTVQKPAVKINHALIIGSPREGTGKDALLVPVKLGIQEYRDVDPVQIEGQYNEWLTDSKLLVIQEPENRQGKRYQISGRLKTVLAAPPHVIDINAKNLRLQPTVNVWNTVIFTNDKGSIDTGKVSRRYDVHWSEVEPWSEEKFNQYWEFVDNGGWRQVMGWLQARDISQYNPKKPPTKTEEFYDFAEAAKSPIALEVRAVLDIWENPDAVIFARLVAVVQGGGFRDAKATAISYALKEMGFTQKRLYRKDGTRVRAFVRNRSQKSNDELLAEIDRIDGNSGD